MISIILVTYNRAERLILSIQDILNQTFKNFELIICDDCSTDATEEICLEFVKKDARIKYYRHSSNMQMPANCNFGIKKAEFEYVAILHDGDRFSPDLIQKWYDALVKNESAGFVFNSIGETDENDNIILRHVDFEEGLIDKDHLLRKIYFRRWLFDSPVYGEVMVRKKLIEDHGFLKSEYSFFADVDLWMDILHSSDAYYYADTLITGPMKSIQPRLFDDSMIKIFLYMFNMHLKHRIKSFKGQPLRFFGELMLFNIYAFLNMNYSLLLVVKNYGLNEYLGMGRLLKVNGLFFIHWTIILALYPVLYPILKLFDLIKHQIPGKRRARQFTK